MTYEFVFYVILLMIRREGCRILYTILFLNNVIKKQRQQHAKRVKEKPQLQWIGDVKRVGSPQCRRKAKNLQEWNDLEEGLCSVFDFLQALRKDMFNYYVHNMQLKHGC